MTDTVLGEWLRLREAADHAARAGVAVRAIARHLPADGEVRIVDLGSGAGSNLRYLLTRLPPRQQWLLVDRSAALLREALARTRVWAHARGLDVQDRDGGLVLRSDAIECGVHVRQQDLHHPAADLFAGRHLVTASALLDLVSARWLRAVAAECRRAGAAALFAITYDGRSVCDPADAADELVRALFNAHQERDKGLGGPAEGPRAADLAEECFSAAGYRVVRARSDWMLGRDAAGMQRVLIGGWKRAAYETAPHLGAQLEAWHARRVAHVDCGRSRVTVGHWDLAALPV